MGFIRVDRKLFKHWIWSGKEPFSRRDAWIDLLQTAHYLREPKKELYQNKLIKIERGQLRAATRYLAERWNWGSPNKVKRFLDLLQSDGMIVTDSTQGINIITISNYGDYNPLSDDVKKEIVTPTVQSGNEGDTDSVRGRDEIQELVEDKEREEIKEKGGATTVANPPSIVDEFNNIRVIINDGNRVKKMESQLTYDEYKRIRGKGYSYEQVIKTLALMENHKSTSKNTSVNLTVQNLIRKQDGKPELVEWRPKFTAAYGAFIKRETAGAITKPKLGGTDYKYLNLLIEHLKENSVNKTYEGALTSFNYIVDKWSLLDGYTQSRNKLSQIYNDIQSIMSQIRKNGSNKGKRLTQKGNGKTQNPEKREY